MTLRIAFYGAGDQARPYLEALARRPEVEIHAVCDLDRRAAEQVAAGWGAQVFLSYEAMLQEIQPDALWVCVPPPLQGDVLLRAADLRIPFFIDPPGAFDFRRAQLYGRAVRESQLVSAIGFPTVHTDIMREAREYVGNNPVPLALGWWLRPARQATSSAATLLWNEACILIDVLRYFCGEVKQVHASAAGNAPETDQAGGMVLHLRFHQDTIAVLTLATFPRPEPRVELELLGEGWTLTFAEGLSTLRVAEHDKTTILRSLSISAEEQTGDFLQAIRGESPTPRLRSYLDALQTLSVCHAAVLSAQEGHAVEMDSVIL